MAIKVFKRASLPEKIKYNNKIYYYSGLTKGKDSVKVEVLPRKFKGKNDVWGSPYKPTIHYYTTKES